ncbi:(deoxy)nucleoside triphosphate pyrophosphohydrolase [Cellulomonas sp.]|uniref:(deoxy)nucleoside triphosphate pyrophosphohydrolase n=1 Tax=Cellulomonas sp. TaxID=40001 RepID=UPI002D226E9C|nr:(deoxy)nucleoside triphosphate pyrophosphohydrolase [Cellulomonas sp.]HYQ77158.1 (deoxy)nucleoside triphosphate pyrophosphohydrolase [Cellulomonas sp.]
MTRPVLVAAAALVDDLAAPGALLAARRRSPVSLAGRWEFPGGKVEPGESPEDAVHREIREELGVAVELGEELAGPDDGAWWLSDRYVMRLWLARVTAGEPRPLVEHDDLRWLPRGQWLTVPWLDADVRIVEALAAATDPADASRRTA